MNLNRAHITGAPQHSTVKDQARLIAMLISEKRQYIADIKTTIGPALAEGDTKAKIACYGKER